MAPSANNKNKYRSVLNTFLSRRDGVDYPNDTVFDAEVLSGITEEDVFKWLQFKAYGKEAPGEDDLPIYARSSTLHFHKKAISSFIANKHFKWNAETATGNPTMSPAINSLIRAVKKHELCAEGVPSQARRALSPDEIGFLIRICGQLTAVFEMNVRMPTMAKFQLHLIARIDFTAHVKKNDLHVHPQFDFALIVRLRWTKNCLEERDAPDQIILGAMESDFCLIIALSIYFQFAFEFTNAAHSQYFFCDTVEDPVSVKTQVSGLLTRRVLPSDDWLEHQRTQGNDLNNATNNCGTHSIRKLACTMARLGGRVQDEVYCQGRWRDTQRVSDRYTSISLPFINANVAATLAVGGPAKYEPKEGSNVSDHWLTEYFVPHIADRMGNRVAVLLGKALLWCLFEPTMSSSIPHQLKTRLRLRYILIQVLPEGVNPIKRTVLSVYPNNGQLQIDPAVVLFRDGDEASTAIPTTADSHQALLSQNHAIRSRVEKLHSTVRNNKESIMQRIGTLQRVVQRFAGRPTIVNHGFVNRRGAINNDNDDEAQRSNEDRQMQQFETTLSKQPRDLYQLWQEWEFGIEGRKAARKFNIQDRGRNRYTFHRRKIVWDRILKLIRNGHSHLTAIDAIYEQRGQD